MKRKDLAMPYELCRHIKANGTPCRAAAMTDTQWCFFHTRLHFRHRAIRSAKRAEASTPLLIPVIEDRESVQVAMSLIIAALASGHITDKRAMTLLRALQFASKNLIGEINMTPLSDSLVRSCLPTLDGLELAPRRMSDGSEPPPVTRAS